MKQILILLLGILSLIGVIIFPADSLPRLVFIFITGIYVGFGAVIIGE